MAEAPARPWSLYVLRCGDGTLYTGIARDLERRLAEHRAGGRKAAKYVRGRGPLELVLHRRLEDRRSASRLESRLKALTKAEKEDLLRRPELFERLLDIEGDGR